MMTASPQALREAVRSAVTGQSVAIDALLTGVIAGGHVLLEGPPGVGKTLACRAVAAAVDARFARIQFTADMLPSDITGCRVYDPARGEFTTVLGPIFANVVLADEINRAPSKVQSALLEAMQERRVTIGSHRYDLADPFAVLATMNPIEGEGTYPLPLAQLDRFCLKIDVGFPSIEDEIAIACRAGGEALPVVSAARTADLIAWRRAAATVHVDHRIARYAAELTAATRCCPEIKHGAGPRATIALIATARARALLQGRCIAIPDDVRSLAPAVLGHRILFADSLLYEERDRTAIVDTVIASVAVP